jgi:hypothetical protein
MTILFLGGKWLFEDNKLTILEPLLIYWRGVVWRGSGGLHVCHFYCWQVRSAIKCQHVFLEESQRPMLELPMQRRIRCQDLRLGPPIK